MTFPTLEPPNHHLKPVTNRFNAREGLVTFPTPINAHARAQRHPYGRFNAREGLVTFPTL